MEREQERSPLEGAPKGSGQDSEMGDAGRPGGPGQHAPVSLPSWGGKIGASSQEWERRENRMTAGSLSGRREEDHATEALMRRLR